MRGDESYAGSESFFRLKQRGRRPHRLPPHDPDAPGPRGGAHPLHGRSASRGTSSPPTRTSTPRAPTSSSPARAPWTCRCPKPPTPRRASTSRATWTSAALEALIAAEGAAQHPARDAHRHQQLRRRAAGLDGEHRSGEGGVRAARHPALPRRLPLRRECLVHPRARARLCVLDAQADRAEDVLASPTAAPFPPRRTPSRISAACSARTTTASRSRRPIS